MKFKFLTGFNTPSGFWLKWSDRLGSDYRIEILHNVRLVALILSIVEYCD